MQKSRNNLLLRMIFPPEFLRFLLLAFPHSVSPWKLASQGHHSRELNYYHCGTHSVFILSKQFDVMVVVAEGNFPPQTHTPGTSFACVSVIDEWAHNFLLSFFCAYIWMDFWCIFDCHPPQINLISRRELFAALFSHLRSLWSQRSQRSFWNQKITVNPFPRKVPIPDFGFLVGELFEGWEGTWRFLRRAFERSGALARFFFVG